MPGVEGNNNFLPSLHKATMLRVPSLDKATMLRLPSQDKATIGIPSLDKATMLNKAPQLPVAATGGMGAGAVGGSKDGIGTTIGLTKAHGGRN